MTKVILTLLATLACVSSLTVSAVQIDGLVRPGKPILWIDEDPDEYVIKLPWSHAFNVTADPSKPKWCVGVGADGTNLTQEQTITLVGPEATTIDIEVIFAAAEWKLSAAPDSFIDVPNNFKPVATQPTTFEGNIVRVENTTTGYMGDQCFAYDSSIAPLDSFRPILELDPENAQWVADQFASGEYPNGTYRGNIFLPAMFARQDDSGYNWVYHFVHGGTIDFVLEFEQDKIQQIRVEGSDVIEPDTLTNPGTVQGKTVYTTHVEGIISNGVRVSLHKPNSDFSLKPSVSQESETNKIPFDLYCQECEGSGVMMIEDGVAVTSNSSYTLLHNDFKDVVANFEVSFEGKPIDELYNDTYVGSFTLMFELDL